MECQVPTPESLDQVRQVPRQGGSGMKSPLDGLSRRLTTSLWSAAARSSATPLWLRVEHRLPLRATAAWESGVAEDLAAALQSDFVDCRVRGTSSDNLINYGTCFILGVFHAGPG
jgi:hypothetical protein